jgi:hypothetical protein
MTSFHSSSNAVFVADTDTCTDITMQSPASRSGIPRNVVASPSSSLLLNMNKTKHQQDFFKKAFPLLLPAVTVVEEEEQTDAHTHAQKEESIATAVYVSAESGKQVITSISNRTMIIIKEKQQLKKLRNQQQEERKSRALLRVVAINEKEKQERVKQLMVEHLQQQQTYRGGRGRATYQDMCMDASQDYSSAAARALLGGAVETKTNAANSQKKELFPIVIKEKQELKDSKVGLGRTGLAKQEKMKRKSGVALAAKQSQVQEMSMPATATTPTSAAQAQDDRVSDRTVQEHADAMLAHGQDAFQFLLASADKHKADKLKRQMRQQAEEDDSAGEGRSITSTSRSVSAMHSHGNGNGSPLLLDADGEVCRTGTRTGAGHCTGGASVMSFSGVSGMTDAPSVVSTSVKSNPAVMRRVKQEVDQLVASGDDVFAYLLQKNEQQGEESAAVAALLATPRMLPMVRSSSSQYSINRDGTMSKNKTHSSNTMSNSNSSISPNAHSSRGRIVSSTHGGNNLRARRSNSLPDLPLETDTENETSAMRRMMEDHEHEHRISFTHSHGNGNHQNKQEDAMDDFYTDACEKNKQELDQLMASHKDVFSYLLDKENREIIEAWNSPITPSSSAREVQEDDRVDEDSDGGTRPVMPHEMVAVAVTSPTNSDDEAAACMSSSLSSLKMACCPGTVACFISKPEVMQAVQHEEREQEPLVATDAANAKEEKAEIHADVAEDIIVSPSHVKVESTAAAVQQKVVLQNIPLFQETMDQTSSMTESVCSVVSDPVKGLRSPSSTTKRSKCNSSSKSKTASLRLFWDKQSKKKHGPKKFLSLSKDKEKDKESANVNADVNKQLNHTRH